MTQLDLSQPLVLSDGRKATLRGNALRGSAYSALVVIEEGMGDEVAWTFNCDGEPETINGLKPNIRLVNAPVTHKLEGTLLMYINHHGSVFIAGSSYQTMSRKIAILDLSKYNLTFVEGEGLEKTPETTAPPAGETTDEM